MGGREWGGGSTILLSTKGGTAEKVRSLRTKTMLPVSGTTAEKMDIFLLGKKVIKKVEEKAGLTLLI